jgi:hypothetical protein
MKKITSLVLAAFAALLLAGTAAAHGFNRNFNYGHNFSVGYNAFAVRAFTFSQPVYAQSSAYFTYNPFALVATPPVPVVTYAAPDPCVQATYAALAPVQTYAAPLSDYPGPVVTATLAPVTYTYGLFGVNNYGGHQFNSGFNGHRGNRFDRFAFNFNNNRNRFDNRVNFNFGFNNRFDNRFDNRVNFNFNNNRNRFDNRFNANFRGNAQIVQESRTIRGPFGGSVTRTRTVAR